MKKSPKNYILEALLALSIGLLANALWYMLMYRPGA